MRFLKIIGLIAVLGVCSVIAAGLLLGRHTEYCPWHHVLLTTESCAVRDRRDGMVLIEHHDTDNMYNRNNYIEIRDGSQSYTFHIPDGHLRLEGSVELIPNEHGALLLNGQRTELKPF